MIGIQERGAIDIEVWVMPIKESRIEELDTHPVEGQWGISQLEKLSLKISETFDIFEDSFVYYKHPIGLSNQIWRLWYVPNHFDLAVYNGGIRITYVQHLSSIIPKFKLVQFKIWFRLQCDQWLIIKALWILNR